MITYLADIYFDDNDNYETIHVSCSEGMNRYVDRFSSGNFEEDYREMQCHYKYLPLTETDTLKEYATTEQPGMPAYIADIWFDMRGKYIRLEVSVIDKYTQLYQFSTGNFEKDFEDVTREFRDKPLKYSISLKQYIEKTKNGTANISGYHKTEIKKGVYGTIEKVIEECHEYKDAREQGINVMALLELSDIYGALSGVLKENWPQFTMEDLAKMAEATERAFKSGARK